MALTPELKIRLTGWSLATALHVTAGALILHALPLGDPLAHPATSDHSGVIQVTLINTGSSPQPAAPALPPTPAPALIPLASPPARPVTAIRQASLIPAPLAQIVPAAAPGQASVGSAAADPAAAISGADADRFREALLARIAQFRRYPPEAQRDRLQGTVWVRLLLDRTGRVVSVSVDQSSGQSSLDAAALAAVRRADPLPAIPSGLPNRLDLTLAVDFSLG
ncbi:MAG TPA: TonB family protein [Caulobacteraceae bacterium]|jgi:protein TonB|nr:TonB family protein [Caulobacteraceae bacterium]